jgi:hypothetical protein
MDSFDYDWVQVQAWKSVINLTPRARDKLPLFSKGKHVILVYHLYNDDFQFAGGHCIGIAKGNIFDSCAKSPFHVNPLDCPLWGYFRKKR